MVCAVAAARAAAQEEHQRQDRQDHAAIGQHRGLPAEAGDAALEHRRPDDAGDILAGRDQGQRGAAAAVEPAADDKRSAAHRSRHCRAGRSAGRGRHRAPRRPRLDSARPAAIDDAPMPAVRRMPIAVGQPAHHDAADAGADPHQRPGQRHDRTVGAQIVLDRLQCRPRRAAARHRRSTGECQSGWRPARSAALDAVGAVRGMVVRLPFQVTLPGHLRANGQRRSGKRPDQRME